MESTRRWSSLPRLIDWVLGGAWLGMDRGLGVVDLWGVVVGRGVGVGAVRGVDGGRGVGGPELGMEGVGRVEGALPCPMSLGLRTSGVVAD